QTVTVEYTTSNVTATGGSDYSATSGTVTFLPGDTSEQIVVPVLGDLFDEANETFSVILSAPANATIADGTGVGTIIDNNDPAPGIYIGDASITESDGGTSTMSFAVTLTGPSGQTVAVQYATSNGTATAPADYTATSGTLTFVPGETSGQIDVPIVGDLLNEVNETFT